MKKIPHKCVHCGQIYPEANKALLEGCSCGSHFFFFIKDEQFEALKQKTIELEQVDTKKVEKDVREMIGIEEEEETLVILDLEAIRVLGQGKFELDVVKIFNKKMPLIYKLEEGKYIIDLASTLKKSIDVSDTKKIFDFRGVQEPKNKQEVLDKIKDVQKKGKK